MRISSTQCARQDIMQASTSSVGFIGLGRMGRGMASNLQKKGFQLQVLDIDAEAVGHVVALGAHPARSVADMARECDIVITMLPTSVEVEAVATGPQGVFANGRKGGVLMDMSTIDPLATDRLHAQALKVGMSLVDAPVGRLAEHADRGESLFMVGASDADFARVKPLLEAMGTTIHHCGDVGSGGRTKIVNKALTPVGSADAPRPCYRAAAHARPDPCSATAARDRARAARGATSAPQPRSPRSRLR